VSEPLESDALTPVGKPVIFALLTAIMPLVAYTISVMICPAHTVWLVVAVAETRAIVVLGLTVTLAAANVAVHPAAFRAWMV
jgi:hypothetical protein